MDERSVTPSSAKATVDMFQVASTNAQISPVKADVVFRNVAAFINLSSKIQVPTDMYSSPESTGTTPLLGIGG
jgi:hypothetical protein